MICPKCGSENVNVQVVTETQLKNKHHSLFWWIFIGWWWIPVKWLFFTFFALIALFLPKRQKLKQKHVSMCVCQNCGNNWKA